MTVKAPPPSVVKAKKDHDDLVAFTKTLIPGVDFGPPVAGSSKRELRQPGAQKLLKFRGLAPRFIPVQEQTIIDFDKPFFHYVYRGEAVNEKGVVVASTESSANSKEDRFAFNWLPYGKVPRGYNHADLKTKEFVGEDNKTVLLYGVPNPDLYSLPNILQRVSQKRAHIAVTLIACQASNIFDAGEASEAPNRSGKSRGEKRSQAITPKQLNLLNLRIAKAKLDDLDVLKFLETNFPYTKTKEGVSKSELHGEDLDAVLRFLEENKK